MTTGDGFKAATASSGKTAKELRGDYSSMAADFTIDQGWDRYTDTDHALWRTLYDRQSKLLPRYAARTFMDCLSRLDAGDGVPDFRRASDMLEKATGWRIVAVPGLIPEGAFFDHLANRRFPVTNWIRKPEEMDYLEEPDVFHDFFGHVPLLLHPVFADYMQAYGKGGQRALGLGRIENLARLYWYTVEFGLIREDGQTKVYGAGILSSAGETPYAIESPSPNRIGFDLERVMRTRYRIDDYQQTYFVIDDYDQLFTATGVDFGPLYERLAGPPEYAPADVLPTDKVYTKGTQQRVLGTKTAAE
ncbi:phenylalanine 4-monooxygenase [Aerophototrophica crusticola]|uniref:Phenylalanine-4-hydroxylase n=2 Tax=Aerophototrophica crusticola TaxID=1709002 RepID=A0A858RAC3_9PROT|nr:phenylalanine 4-monooxygenase [Rhodospirillaceae bacterium B3]